MAANPTNPDDGHSPARGPVKVFFSYAKADEEMAIELESHLALLERQGIIEGWHRRRIMAGDQLPGAMKSALDAAEIIILLASAAFIESDQNYAVEMARALERHEAKEARVIPIILCPCDWVTAPFAHLEVLPKNRLPVACWMSRNSAWVEVAKEIRNAAAALRGQGTDRGGSMPSEPKRANIIAALKASPMLMLLFSIFGLLTFGMVKTCSWVDSWVDSVRNENIRRNARNALIGQIEEFLATQKDGNRMRTRKIHIERDAQTGEVRIEAVLVGPQGHGMGRIKVSDAQLRGLMSVHGLPANVREFLQEAERVRVKVPLDLPSEAPTDGGGKDDHPDLADALEYQIPVFIGAKCHHKTGKFGTSTFRDCDDEL